MFLIIDVQIFAVNEGQINRRAIHLTLHGVDTVAYLDLNDHSIGVTNNMFVRYVFDVKQYLHVSIVNFENIQTSVT